MSPEESIAASPEFAKALRNAHAIQVPDPAAPVDKIEIALELAHVGSG